MEANRGIGHRQSRLAAGHRRRRGEAALTAEHDAASLQPIDPLDSQHGRSACVPFPARPLKRSVQSERLPPARAPHRARPRRLERARAC